ncbi:MAG: 50S ribosomal protein L24 [Firmicutes bacterium]|nr:50S ribosomal protein L24 [Bacillota bacterium]
MFVRHGDKVLILSGKDKGKKGKVIAAEPGAGKVKVEGINIVKKHAKATAKVPQAGIREMEAPLAASKVMVICPACNQPTRIRRERDSDGRGVRVCRRCGESLDK